MSRSAGFEVLGLIVLLGMVGCAPGVEGAYRDAAGAVTYQLEKGGRAYITVLGATVAATYTADAERVIVTSPQGTTVLSREDDRLRGPMGLVLQRVEPGPRVSAAGSGDSSEGPS